MRVIRYAFRTEKLKNATIFKLPEFPNGISYVTEIFKNVVEENNIKGFKLKNCNSNYNLSFGNRINSEERKRLLYAEIKTV